MTYRSVLPNRRGNETFNFTTSDGQRYVATISRFRNGQISEIFLSANKAGSATDANARDAAVTCSIALQHGVPAEVIRQALVRDDHGQASGPLGEALDILHRIEITA